VCGNAESDEFREFRAGTLGCKRPWDKLISRSLCKEAGDNGDDDEQYGRNIKLQPSPQFAIYGPEFRMSRWCCLTH